mgnify:CR=1 FL=1
MSKTGKFLPPAMRVAGTIESARRDARTVSGPMIRNLCDVVESADFEIQKLVRAMRYVATNTRDGWARDWLFRVVAERGAEFKLSCPESTRLAPNAGKNLSSIMRIRGGTTATADQVSSAEETSFLCRTKTANDGCQINIGDAMAVFLTRGARSRKIDVWFLRKPPVLVNGNWRDSRAPMEKKRYWLPQATLEPDVVKALYGRIPKDSETAVRVKAK